MIHIFNKTTKTHLIDCTRDKQLYGKITITMFVHKNPRKKKIIQIKILHQTDIKLDEKSTHGRSRYQTDIKLQWKRKVKEHFQNCNVFTHLPHSSQKVKAISIKILKSSNNSKISKHILPVNISIKSSKFLLIPKLCNTFS
jgi:hypothetical protein